jgi:hypothetical protein
MPPLKQPQFEDREVMTTQMKVSDVSQPEDRHIARPARNLPFLMDGDFLQVTNDDHRTWDFQWERKHYVIEPGDTSFVAFEALVDYLGDPRSMEGQLVKYSDGNGNKGIVMDRYAELSRLFGRYAVENENIDSLVEKAPKVEVKTLAGQTVRFPSQMPDMAPWPTPNVNPLAVNADTTKMIDAVAAENEDLRSSIKRLEERLDKAITNREGVDSTTE